MNQVGRPTKYDSNMIARVYVYLAEVMQNPKQLPKIEDVAIELNVNKDTLYEWGKQHPEFSDALKDVMTMQAKRLVDDGIYGETNATIVKLMLQNNHGFRDRAEVQQTNIDKEVSDEKLDELNAKLNIIAQNNKPTPDTN